MRSTKRRWWEGALVLGLSFLVMAVLARPVGAQENAGGEAAEGGGEAEEPEAYQFNLAPAKTAPGAIAEILLVARPEGGYAAEMAATALPEPASLKPDATTYVVWLYDATTKKRQSVASLTPEAGGGIVTFDVLWPKFALVVTAESSAAPKDWSGIAVLTGQPTVPENPGPDTEAAAQAAAQPTAAAAAPAADTSQPAQPAADASASAAGVDQSAAAGAASREAAGGPGAVPADSQAGQPPAGQIASPAEAGAGAAGGVVADAGGQVADSTVQAAGTECVNAPAEEKPKKKKKRFSNPTLDAMANAQRGAEPCKQPADSTQR
jgi:hypothetical protein